MNRELPGFYYDPDKKKYFRIQSNSMSLPGSKYSKDAIKKRRDRQRAYEESAKARHRILAERLKRSRCLSHPLIHLDREMGNKVAKRQILQQQSRAYFSQLRRRRVHRLGQRTVGICDFVRHPRTGMFMIGYNENLICGTGLASPVSATSWEYSSSRQKIKKYADYRISSLSLSHSGFCLCTFEPDTQGNAFLEVGNIPDPEIYGDCPWQYYNPARLDVSSSYGLWCSSSRPTPERPFFAVGTSAGLNSVEATEADWVVVEHAPRRRDHARTGDHQAIMSVDWISPSVVVAGQRDSGVILYDMRSRDYATRLQHAHGVERIRAIDANKLVVAGHGIMNIYDIRYPLNGIQPRPRPNDKSHTFTKPYLSFPRSNESRDFDICPELNTLATTTTDNRLELYSLLDASALFLPSSPSSIESATDLQQVPAFGYECSYQQYHYPDRVSRIKFESGEFPSTERDVPRLLVACGNAVDEWSWG